MTRNAYEAAAVTFTDGADRNPVKQTDGDAQVSVGEIDRSSPSCLCKLTTLRCRFPPQTRPQRRCQFPNLLSVTGVVTRGRKRISPGGADQAPKTRNWTNLKVFR
ncbi:hypothetical protein SRHO_G00184280 [Serrasalmus rhombeus]